MSFMANTIALPFMSGNSSIRYIIRYRSHGPSENLNQQFVKGNVDGDLLIFLPWAYH